MPAPPKKRPSAAVENLIAFEVTRVLKGEFKSKVVTIQTLADATVVGKSWIVMLRPEFLSGKNQYGGVYTIKLESEVRSILEADDSGELGTETQGAPSDEQP